MTQQFAIPMAGAEAIVLDSSVITAPIRLPAQAPTSHRPFGRPAWRGRMHTWAFVAAVPAGCLLVLSADHTASRIAATIYAATLVLLFGTSAAYHRLTRCERSRSIMQRLDHSMIYLLIVGTYTPLCLVVLPPTPGIPLLGMVVVAAAVGIVLKLVAFERARWLSYTLYPIMGSGLVLAGPALAQNLSTVQLGLIVGGGLAYTIGFPVLMVQRPNPWPQIFGYHEIWHTLTVVAAGAHFLAILDVVNV